MGREYGSRTKKVHLLREGRGACGLKLKGRRKAIVVAEEGDIDKITCRRCEAKLSLSELVPVSTSQEGS